MLTAASTIPPPNSDVFPSVNNFHLISVVAKHHRSQDRIRTCYQPPTHGAFPNTPPDYLRLRIPLCCKHIVTFNSFIFYQYFPSHRNNTILLIVMEYPSRSNLNCLIVVLRGPGRKGAEFRFHSGLSTSVEWGKPLSIFLLFQRTFSFCVGASPPSHFLTPVSFTNV
jgi:hypothetical protein